MEEIKDSSEPPLPPPDPGLKEEFERLRKLQAQIEAERKQKMGATGTPPKVETISSVSPPPAPQPLSPPQESLPRDEGQPKSRGWWLAVVGVLILGLVAGGALFIIRSNRGAEEVSTTEVTPPPEEPSLTPAQERDKQRKEDLKTIQTALEKYFAAKGSYPLSAKFDKTNDPASVLKQAFVPTYIASLPIDPNDPTNYYGYKSVDGKTYELTSILEDKTDPEGETVGGIFLYVLRPEKTSSQTPSSSSQLPVQ